MRNFHAILLVSFAFIAIYLIYSLYFATAKSVDSAETIDTSLCQFSQGECTKEIANISLSLRISPPHAPSQQPLVFLLHASTPIDDVQVMLVGRDMFMGVIPVKLTQLNALTHSGELIYGSCSSQYMVWRANVHFTINEKPHNVIFDFLADNNEPHVAP